jgi:pilus assembly protein CpaE
MMTEHFTEAEPLGLHMLSVAVIGPDENRRKQVAGSMAGPQSGLMREFAAYPALDDVPHLLEADHDVIIIELDSDPEHALDLVEQICGNSQATVMVYSARSDSDLLVRCMRAGAREFLTHPIAPSTLVQALVRAAARRPSRAQRKTAGRLFAFTGAKGGSGVTTLASNFAVAMAQESGQRTLLIDLSIPLGDAALTLGVTALFSAANALQEYSRLDSNFLSKLLAKHSSGLFVLAAPDLYVRYQASNEAVERLLTVARQDFDYVVVDAGSSTTQYCPSVFEMASTVFLVSQVSITELRNSNRLITGLFASCKSKLEVVLNRYTPRSLGIDEEHITKALTQPANWKVPSDHVAVRQSQNMATPLAAGDSPIARTIQQMARTACGLAAVPEKKKKFGLFK